MEANLAEKSNPLITALLHLGLQKEELSELFNFLANDTVGLMIYGSRARGDFLETSDFDLLRLSPSATPTIKIGRVSVSSYTATQLGSATKTLFGTHLIRDGKILFDPTGSLAHAMSQIAPADPEDLLKTVHRYSTILDEPDTEKAKYCSGMVRLARYLLRTAVYAKAMRTGKPCFSVRELAGRFNDASLVVLLASDPDIAGPPSEALLKNLCDRLAQIVGPPPHNEFGSISALAVETWDTDRNLAALAVRAASENEETLDYSDLPKVLL